jgi:hypothetical protein
VTPRVSARGSSPAPHLVRVVEGLLPPARMRRLRGIVESGQVLIRAESAACTHLRYAVLLVDLGRTISERFGEAPNPLNRREPYWP